MTIEGGEIVEEKYEHDCPLCGKHFVFEFDEKSVYVRPFYLHLAYDHTEEMRKSLKES